MSRSTIASIGLVATLALASGELRAQGPVVALCLVDDSCEPAPPAFGGADWFASVLLADAAFAVGMLAGGTLGAAAARDCPDGAEGFSQPGCSFDALGRGVLMGAAVGTAGAATAIYVFGETSGHEGSYLATLGGTSAGTLAAYGLLAVIDSENEAAFFATLFTLPALAGTLAYALSLDTDDWRPAGSGLLNIDEQGGVALGVPAIGWSSGPDGDSLGVTLVDGAF